MLVILTLPLIGMWVKLLTVPYRYLYPSILVFMAVGVFSLSNNPWDVLIMAIFGVCGLYRRKRQWGPAADNPRLNSRPAEGGEPGARDAALARRPDGIPHQAD